MGNHIEEKPKIAAGADVKPDVEAYFNRISLTGEKTPTLETLQTIHLQHPSFIPFENLNPLLRLPVKLDLSSIQEKLVKGKRGGYCFEHNLLLGAVLRSIGFNVKGLAARVLWNNPEGLITPRGHMLLLVDLDGENYIADVGFGGLTLTTPLLLKAGVSQSTPHETFRLLSVNNEFRLEAEIRGEWKPVYQFGLQEHFTVDYEVTSWYLSNHPASHFVTGLIAARVATERRYTLRNNEMATHYLHGQTERRIIKDADELELLLRDIFNIEVAEKHLLKPALAKIVGNNSK